MVCLPKLQTLTDMGVRIGISGWRYPRWRGTFYPQGLAQKRELSFAAGKFSSIELNGSFYSLQRPSSFELWNQETPRDFVFAIKGSRYITHMLKLKGIEAALANFFAQGVLALGNKLGPILWQFPEALHFNQDRFEQFFAQLPHSRKEASKLAASHDARLEGRSFFDPLGDGPVRHAIEVRHESFGADEFYELLRRYRVASVVSDTAGRFPMFEEVTADVVYVRLHGSTALYQSRYSDEELEQWGERIRKWRRARKDVYVYFDNDAKVHAPFDAQRLIEISRRRP